MKLALASSISPSLNSSSMPSRCSRRSCNGNASVPNAANAGSRPSACRSSPARWPLTGRIVARASASRRGNASCASGGRSRTALARPPLVSIAEARKASSAASTRYSTPARAPAMSTILSSSHGCRASRSSSVARRRLIRRKRRTASRIRSKAPASWSISCTGERITGWSLKSKWRTASASFARAASGAAMRREASKATTATAPSSRPNSTTPGMASPNQRNTSPVASTRPNDSRVMCR